MSFPLTRALSPADLALASTFGGDLEADLAEADEAARLAGQCSRAPVCMTAAADDGELDALRRAGVL